VSGYTDKERVQDLRRVAGALESGRRNFDEDIEQAARRLDRLSSLTLLELVIRVQRSGVTLALRPEPPPRIVHFE